MATPTVLVLVLRAQVPMIQFGLSKKVGTARLALLFQRLITNCTKCTFHPQNCGGKPALYTGADSLIHDWDYTFAPSGPQLWVNTNPPTVHTGWAPALGIARNPYTRFLSTFLDKGLGVVADFERKGSVPCFGWEAMQLFEKAGGKKPARNANRRQTPQYVQVSAKGCWCGTHACLPHARCMPCDMAV